MRLITVVVATVATVGAQDAGKGRGRGGGPPAPIKISIPAFPDGGTIPAKFAYTQAGNLSPAIQWSGVPSAAVTLALILHDADVPSRPNPEDTLHWAIFNIPASATGLPEGVPHNTGLEDGSVQWKYVDGVPRLAVGTIGYFGPSPPPGAPAVHHYIFDLYALDVKLDPGVNSRADLMKAMAGHVLAKGAYFGVYSR